MEGLGGAETSASKAVESSASGTASSKSRSKQGLRWQEHLNLLFDESTNTAKDVGPWIEEKFVYDMMSVLPSSLPHARQCEYISGANLPEFMTIMCDKCGDQIKKDQYRHSCREANVDYCKPCWHESIDEKLDVINEEDLLHLQDQWLNEGTKVRHKKEDRTGVISYGPDVVGDYKVKFDDNGEVSDHVQKDDLEPLLRESSIQCPAPFTAERLSSSGTIKCEGCKTRPAPKPKKGTKVRHIEEGRNGVVCYGPDSDGDYKVKFDDDGEESGYVQRDGLKLLESLEENASVRFK